jgi:hypothetical protein
VMLFTDQTTIREVIFFPHLRQIKENPAGDAAEATEAKGGA